MNNHFSITHPIDGDMLHSGDGILVNGKICYRVSVNATPQAEIFVNGSKASRSHDMFTAFIVLDLYENNIEVRDESTGDKASITVYRLPTFAGGYRLSIDDNIWFLQDIHANEHVYQSIFENPYLGFLKLMHEIHGTCIHVNLFYQTDGFNLSQLSDKFRSEWSAQAHWLRLSFHALQEKPDMPYRDASYDVVQKDCLLVMNEIRRFAGESLMGPVTTLHWGEANAAGCRALRDAGYAGLLGYFNADDDQPSVSYYLNLEQRRHLKKRFIWKDTSEGIIFIRASIVLDRIKLDEIVPFLDNYHKKGRKPPFADLLIHEQYYYPFYEQYQPDYCQKVEKAILWAVNNNYRPAFLGDCITG